MPVAVGIGLLLLLAYFATRGSSAPAASPDNRSSGALGGPSVVVNAAPQSKQATAGPVSPNKVMEPIGKATTQVNSTTELLKDLSTALPALATAVGTTITTAQKTSDESELAIAKLQGTLPNDANNTGLGKRDGSTLRAPAGSEAESNLFGASSGTIGSMAEVAPSGALTDASLYGREAANGGPTAYQTGGSWEPLTAQEAIGQGLVPIGSNDAGPIWGEPGTVPGGGGAAPEVTGGGW